MEGGREAKQKGKEHETGLDSLRLSQTIAEPRPRKHAVGMRNSSVENILAELGPFL